MCWHEWNHLKKLCYLCLFKIHQSIKLHFYGLVLKCRHLLISFLLFLCNPCHWSCIFVIIVFLFLLFINDIDSLWFAFLCYVFLYCLSWNPWSANYSEVQTIKLPNPMFSSQALHFNNTISVSISPLKNKFFCNLYFDIAQWRLWPLMRHVHLVFKYKLLQNCLKPCFRVWRRTFYLSCHV